MKPLIAGDEILNDYRVFWTPNGKLHGETSGVLAFSGSRTMDVRTLANVLSFWVHCFTGWMFSIHFDSQTIPYYIRIDFRSRPASSKTFPGPSKATLTEQFINFRRQWKETRLEKETVAMRSVTGGDTGSLADRTVPFISLDMKTGVNIIHTVVSRVRHPQRARWCVPCAAVFQIFSPAVDWLPVSDVAAFRADLSQTNLSCFYA